MNDRAGAPDSAAASPAGLWAWLRRRLQSTPVRTFAIYPVVVLQRFGAPYAAYCGHVKRWIPGLI
jgi:hypothetical protein